MIGAVVGDVVGSRFEFDNHKPIGPSLIDQESTFTDETVCIAALSDALVRNAPIDKTLREWCRLYPQSSYGGMFYRWILDDHAGPYGSFGNGCLARVSVAVAHSREPREASDLIKRLTEVTHNHEHSLSSCSAIVRAMTKILTQKNATHGSGLDRQKNEVRALLGSMGVSIPANRQAFLATKEKFSEGVLETVPPALLAVVFGENFEDTLRLCIARGGDVDTICSLAGSFAEIMYGVPEDLKNQVFALIPQEMHPLIRKIDFTWTIE